MRFRAQVRGTAGGIGAKKAQIEQVVDGSRKGILLSFMFFCIAIAAIVGASIYRSSNTVATVVAIVGSSLLAIREAMDIIENLLTLKTAKMVLRIIETEIRESTRKVNDTIKEENENGN